MKITIIGTGYVGLVTGTCFAEVGIQVSCVDVDKQKIDNLNKGIIPIFEPGLEELVHRNVKKERLYFTTDLPSAIKGCEVIFSAVGTPPDEDGSADLSYVLDVAREVGRNMNNYILVATKSTVPVGTAEKVRNIIQKELNIRKSKLIFDVASNPEFLKEGAAIEDFMRPDRIVVGVDSSKAKNLMKNLYKPFTMNGHPVIFMDVLSAEMTKYTANSMLATKISFMNDIANLCEIVGADVKMVQKGIGSDTRIGSKFIYPGAGYGGSCFPKDVKALIKTADDNSYSLKVLKAVEEVNEKQKSIIFKKISTYYEHNLQGKKIALWGLSFKPKTDDMREAPSLVVIRLLLEAGASVSVYDPIAIDEGKRILGNTVIYAANQYEALEGANCLTIITEWSEFKSPDFARIKSLIKDNVIFDGRNIYDATEIKKLGFEYSCIGTEIKK
ncbi:MAG: UDP-glucose/GDP-mannose dehydrogenase family protein [Bacteroidetes bacterium]|nr:UDP-glucose/GDP-mannose dehydrogenase family protein [Bacteroidota bacterium]